VPNTGPLSGRDYAAAGIKWIAVGGSAFTALAAPVIGVPVNIVTDLFLLLDP
jgi:hypothetical protein